MTKTVTNTCIRPKRAPGPPFDNALAETVNGYYKAELVRGPKHPGPWKTVEELELATLGWVHWHNQEPSTASSATFRQQSSKRRSMLKTVRQQLWQKTQFWGLYKTQDGSVKICIMDKEVSIENKPDTEMETRASGVFPLYLGDEVVNKLVFWDYWSLRGNIVRSGFLTLRNVDGTVLARSAFPGGWSGPTELVAENIFPEIRQILPPGHTGSIELEVFYESKPKFTFPAVSLVYSAPSLSAVVHTSMRYLNLGEQVEDPFIGAPQTGFDVYLEPGIENYVIAFLGDAGTEEIELAVSGNLHEVRKVFPLNGSKGSAHTLGLDFLSVEDIKQLGGRPKVQILTSQTNVFPRFFCMTKSESAPVPTLTHSFFDIKSAVVTQPQLAEYAESEPADKSMYSSSFLVPLFDPANYETSIETYDCIAPFGGEVSLNLCSASGKILETKIFNSSPGGFFQRRESISLAEVFDLDEVSGNQQVEMVLRADGKIPIRQKVALNVKQIGAKAGTNICFSAHTVPDRNQGERTRHHWFPIGGPDRFIGTVHFTRHSDYLESVRNFEISIFKKNNVNFSLQKKVSPGGFFILSPELEPDIFDKLAGELGYVYIESKGMPFNSFFFSVKNSGLGGDHAF